MSTPHSSLSQLLYITTALVLIQTNNVTAAGIDLHNVSSGSIGVTYVDPTHTNITASNGSIGNFNSFDIASGHFANVIQPDSSSSTLFRVIGGNETKILGSLNANGKLMLVNPNGIFFGANAKVDVAGLIASTADTTDADFLSNKMNFSIAGTPDATIVNKGKITAKQGGLVALVAPSVRNDGLIQANLGTVVLASAQTATIDFYGDNLYSFTLGDATDAAPLGETSTITNTGNISSGRVILTAKAASDIVDNVINTTGIITATSAHIEGGTIVLDGGEGKVKIGGKINATNNSGSVKVKAKTVTMDSGAVTSKAGEISVDTTDIAMTNSSIKSLSSNVKINNTGKFESNTANVISGKSVLLNQSSAGSIQNAIDAVGTTGSGGATLQLGSGTWAENIIMNQGYFTLKGNGAANTILNAATPANPIISVPAVSAVTISDLTVNGGTTGISLNGSKNALISGNTFTNNIVGINSTNTNLSKVQGNFIEVGANATGIKSNNDTSLSISSNGIRISDAAYSVISQVLGIDFKNALGVSIKDNRFALGYGTDIKAIDSSSIVMDGNGSFSSFGFNANNIKGLIIKNNGFYGSQIDISNSLNTSFVNNGMMFGFGINIDSSTNTTIQNNRLNEVGGYGVTVTNAKNTLIDSNNLQFGGGIFVGGTNTTISNNYIESYTNGIGISGSRFWVLGNNVYGGDTALSITNGTDIVIGRNNSTDANTFSGGIYTIQSSGGNRLTIDGNNISSRYTLDINGTNNVNINKNKISNNTLKDTASFGVNLLNVLTSVITNNNISNYTGNYGIAITGSNNALISANSFTNNRTSIQNTNSTNTRIYGNSFSGNSSQSGIIFTNITQSLISDALGIKNSFTGLGDAVSINGGSSVVVANNNFTNVVNGVRGINSAGLRVSGNNFTNTTTPGHTAIYNEGGTKFTALNNYIDRFSLGIRESGATRSSLLSNSFKNISTAGIYIDGDGNHHIIDGNTMSDFDTTTTHGIYFRDNNVTASNNNISGTGFAIYAQAPYYFNEETGELIIYKKHNAYFVNNTLDNNAFGITVSDYDNVEFRNNTVSNTWAGYGISAGASEAPANNIKSTGNLLIGNYSSELYSLANNIQINGNTYIDNTNSIQLGSGTGFSIKNVTIINNAAHTNTLGSIGIGLLISGPETVTFENVDITGSNTGIYICCTLDNAKFIGNTSSFTNVNKYFEIGSNGSPGGALDVSAQIFDGIRASDFTLAQRTAAEAKTTDFNDNPTLGDISYVALP